MAPPARCAAPPGERLPPQPELAPRTRGADCPEGAATPEASRPPSVHWRVGRRCSRPAGATTKVLNARDKFTHTHRHKLVRRGSPGAQHAPRDAPDECGCGCGPWRCGLSRRLWSRLKRHHPAQASAPERHPRRGRWQGVWGPPPRWIVALRPALTLAKHGATQLPVALRPAHAALPLVACCSLWTCMVTAAAAGAPSLAPPALVSCRCMASRALPSLHRAGQRVCVPARPCSAAPIECSVPSHPSRPAGTVLSSSGSAQQR